MALKTFKLSVVIGTAVTLVLFGLGYVAAERGAAQLSYVLYWQAYALYMALPCSVSITPGEFLCESMTAARITFYAGLPLGVVVYSAGAYCVMWLVGRRSARPPQA